MFWEDHGRPTFVWLYHMTGPVLWLMPALALALWARHRLRSARRRPESAGEPADFTGRGPPRRSSARRASEGVAIIEATGPLADFYDAPRRELRLSAPTFAGRSPWSLAVAAREAGHALGGRWALDDAHGPGLRIAPRRARRLDHLRRRLRARLPGPRHRWSPRRLGRGARRPGPRADRIRRDPPRPRLRGPRRDRARPRLRRGPRRLPARARRGDPPVRPGTIIVAIGRGCGA